MWVENRATPPQWCRSSVHSDSCGGPEHCDAGNIRKPLVLCRPHDAGCLRSSHYRAQSELLLADSGKVILSLLYGDGGLPFTVPDCYPDHVFETLRRI